jgi:hypothetical protein
LPWTKDFETRNLHFACPVEATLAPMDWCKWYKVAKGVDEFNDIQYHEQWAAYTGTRRQFLYELQESFEAYVAHKHHVNTFNWSWKRAEHKLLLDYAVTGVVPAGGVPAMGGCDWASTVDHMRAFTMTCAYPERSQLFVVVVAHSPYLAKVPLPPAVFFLV